MVRQRCSTLFGLVLLLSGCGLVCAQEEPALEPPKIYLDRSPRIIAYQLKRLSNQRLLTVERSADDPKFLPVFRAILVRDGMPLQQRKEALAAIVGINKSSSVEELVTLLETLPVETASEQTTATALGRILLKQPVDILKASEKNLRNSIKSDNVILRIAGQAALLEAGFDLDGPSVNNRQSELDWLASVPWVPSESLRNELRPKVVKGLASADKDIQRAAIAALRAIGVEQRDTFKRVAKLASSPDLSAASYQTLLTIPIDQRESKASQDLAEQIVDMAENTPAAERTTDQFVDAMQLVDQLMVVLPVQRARQYRDRLEEVSVRLVRIATIEDEMRYDRPFFAVQAGRPVQIVLENHDLMAHNLLIVNPGTLKEVAEAGLAAGPKDGYQGKPYVPESDDVLFASGLIPAFQKEVLTFTAPSEPGEYPFVCTFPQHWSRMYGVMVVVDDLEAWLQKPVTPKDPIGSNRAFVKDWSLDDFKDGLARGLQGRTMKIGERIFKEATCAQCHQLNGVGGKVGPHLDDVFQRYKGDALAVLQEILDPSNRIDEKYAMHMILTVDGLTITGIIQTENDERVTLLDNPESEQATVVQREEIEEMVKTSKSIMPKALVNQFTKDEILEMLAYLKASQKPLSNESSDD